MPSVIVTWSGQSPDLTVQKNICEKLKTIAELSHSYFGEETPIKYFDQDITGNIIIDAGLVGEDITCKSAEKIVHEYIEERDEEVSALLDTIFETTTEPEHKRDVYYALTEAKLYGIEFCLYDPRDVDFSYNRISFVFLQMKDCPDLNGRIIQAVDKELCKKSPDKIIKAADWYLTGPSLDLRYFCEQWIYHLMGWIKYFYVSNLNYWWYEENAGYEKFSRFVAEKAVREPDVEKLSIQVLELLRSEFREEIRSWIEKWGVRERDDNV